MKSNLYKHMKIHKKNAELGITTGRGRHHHHNNTTATPSTSTSATAQKNAQPPRRGNNSNLPPPPPIVNTLIKVDPPQPKIKHIKVEDRIIEVKQEPGLMTSHSFQVASSTRTSANMHGGTSMDVVVENPSDLGGAASEHRGPIVVSIVTDGQGGGPGNILHLDPEQQAQLLSAVTSLATSQGQTVTVAAAPSSSATAYIASPLQTSSAATSSHSSSVTAVSSSHSSTAQDPILGVSNTQFYTNTQQFFTSLDQLQN